jgi:hypothetical protein
MLDNTGLDLQLLRAIQSMEQHLKLIEKHLKVMAESAAGTIEALGAIEAYYGSDGDYDPPELHRRPIVDTELPFTAGEPQ